MSAVVECSRAHTPGTLGSTAAPEGSSQEAEQVSSALNYSTSPEVTNLQKVTELLKERLTSRREDDAASDKDITSAKNSDSFGNSEIDYLSHAANRRMENGVADLTNMVSRHAMSIMRNDVIVSDSSNVLREMLQTSANQGDMDSAGQDSMIGKLLQRNQETGLVRNNSYDIDVDGDSAPSITTPCDFSSEDLSDHEINLMSATSPGGMDFIDEDDSNFNGDLNISGNSENSDMKKARVETIISSMNRTSPGKDNPLTPIDQRRHKRKQYTPQQHDTSLREFSDEPGAKVRRLEHNILQQQLKHMQDQLATMQQRYTDLFEHQAANGNIDLAEVERRCQQRQQIINGMQEKELKLHELSNRHGLLEPVEIDSSPFIREAKKLVNSRIDNCKPQFSPIGGDTPKDLVNLAQMLKNEIAHSVGTLVDTVVAKFAEKQKGSQHSPPQKDHTNESPAPVSPVEKEKPSPTGTDERPKTPTQPQISHSIQKITNNNNEVKPIHITPTKSEETHLSPFPHHPHHSPEKHSPISERLRIEQPKPTRTKVTDKIIHPFFDHPKPSFAELLRHAPLFPPPYFHPAQMPHHPLPMFVHPQPKISEPEPEQTEALALVVNTPKKKRTKVTDTRLSPRAARALLQEPVPTQTSNPDMPDHRMFNGQGDRVPPHHPHHHSHPEHLHHPPPPPLLPVSLPTSVAIPNPSLQHSEILGMFPGATNHNPFVDFTNRIPTSRSPSVRDHGSPNMNMSHSEFGMFRGHSGGSSGEEMFDMEITNNIDGYPMTTTLTPMHLRKAKLMFFYNRYPSSSILKIYFPDIKFNKNNTAQLVKWFSNFREFFYIQMEKYARQALAEGVKNPEDMIISTDSELYRVLNLHYNRNNQLEVPENFRVVVQSTLREFYKSISGGKDTEQSWKKSIYKVIARMDDSLPEYFKSTNWMEQLNDH